MRKQFQWDASLFGRFLAFLGILGVLTQYVAVPILTECLGIRLDNVQGDTSGLFKPFIDIKLKVAFYYKESTLQHSFCFDVNNRFEST